MKNMGDIGFKEYCITPDGAVYSLKSRRFLNLQYNDNGYVVITLRKDGKTKTLRVHRLVALMYLKDSHFEGAHVNHKDGDKTNNHISNLEWVTRQANMRHAYDNNLIISKPRAFTDDDIHSMCHHLEQGVRVVDVARMFNIEREIVDRIYRGTLYKHISYEYDFSKVPKQKRISVESVLGICRLLEQGLSCRDISNQFNIHISSVKAIKQRRTHRHISDSFTW